MQKLKYATMVISTGYVLSPTILLAQSVGGGGQGGVRGGGQSSSGVAPTGGSGTLTNPLGEGSTLIGFLMGILDVLLTFAIPIIVLFIMYAGFLYVTAQGDESKIKTAHAALTWSVVGGVIVLAANIIIEVIQNTVDAI